MSTRLTHTLFAKHEGERFQVKREAQPSLEFELIEVSTLPSHADPADPADLADLAPKEPFSLVFRGPRDILLEQRIYTLEHATLGKLEIFLVPLGPDKHGLRYEAVFN